MEKIDFVLPWVDGSDIAWQEEKAKYNPHHDGDANATARFRDMGTLKYVLRAIEQNCPWYHKIYLITAGHYPAWLDREHEKVVLVTHEELYLDKTHLPTFNSVSIEMNLANLKALSDKFVYLNDDFMIMNALKQERFFIDDKPVDFLSHGWMARNVFFEKIKERDSWVFSLNNTLNLINRKFAPLELNHNSLYHKSYSLADKVSNFLLNNVYKKFLWLDHWHHPQPFLKRTLAEVYNEFTSEITESSKNRFRSNADLNQYIYRYWQFATNNFYAYKHNDALIANLGSEKILDMLINKIESKKRINFVCFNDDVNLSDSQYEQVKEKLVDYLESKFPNKASFEI